eukprot:138014-Chlamydomonas_euryale.AAC.6
MKLKTHTKPDVNVFPASMFRVQRVQQQHVQHQHARGQQPFVWLQHPVIANVYVYLASLADSLCVLRTSTRHSAEWKCLWGGGRMGRAIWWDGDILQENHLPYEEHRPG